MLSRLVPTESRILVVLLGAIGDVVRGFSILTPIKAALPNSHITWVVEPRSYELVKNHPNIDSVILFQRAEGILGFLKLLREIRKNEYDITLDLQRHLKSGAISFASGSSRRIGFSPSDSKEFNWIFNNEYIDSFGDTISKVSHYLKFLPKLGLEIPDEDEIDFGLTAINPPSKCIEFLDRVAPNSIGLVLGSTWPTKDWPNEGYLGLTSRLLSDGKQQIVLLGDKSRTTLAQELCSLDNSNLILNLVGRTTLFDLLFVIKKLAACIGPDSGPGHMAAAVGTPYIAIFGPTSPTRVAPFGSEHLVLKSQIGCSPCYRRQCPGLDTLCMRLVTPDAVLEKLKSLE